MAPHRHPPPQLRRRRGGRIQPWYWVAPVEACWLCGRRGSRRWGGKAWCWRHHPLRPTFRSKKFETKLVPENPLRWDNGIVQRSTDTSTRDIERHQRKVDAILGRKKRKPAKPRRRPRDRRYRR